MEHLNDAIRSASLLGWIADYEGDGSVAPLMELARMQNVVVLCARLRGGNVYRNTGLRAVLESLLGERVDDAIRDLPTSVPYVIFLVNEARPSLLLVSYAWEFALDINHGARLRRTSWLASRIALETHSGRAIEWFNGDSQWTRGRATVERGCELAVNAIVRALRDASMAGLGAVPDPFQ